MIKTRKEKIQVSNFTANSNMTNVDKLLLYILR